MSNAASAPGSLRGRDPHAPLCFAGCRWTPPCEGQIPKDRRRVLSEQQRPRGLRQSDKRQFVYVAWWIRFQTDVGMDREGGCLFYSVLLFYKCVFVFVHIC